MGSNLSFVQSIGETPKEPLTKDTNATKISSNNEIPDVFLSSKQLTFFYKYCPKVLIGKHQLKFPINVPLMFKHSPYFQTLLEATEIDDFSKVKILSDYDITYENEAFMALWLNYNLTENEKFLSFEKVNLKILFETRIYACYFGFPIIDKIDQQICQQKDIPYEFQADFKPIYKKRFISHMEKSLVFLHQPGRHDWDEYDEQKFEYDLFDDFAHLFQPEHKHRLEVVTEVYPDFQLMFVAMVKRLMGGRDCDEYEFRGNKRAAMNLWYRNNPQLKDLTLPRGQYNIGLWKI